MVHTLCVQYKICIQYKTIRLVKLLGTLAMLLGITKNKYVYWLVDITFFYYKYYSYSPPGTCEKARPVNTMSQNIFKYIKPNLIATEKSQTDHW